MFHNCKKMISDLQQLCQSQNKKWFYILRSNKGLNKEKEEVVSRRKIATGWTSTWSVSK